MTATISSLPAAILAAQLSGRRLRTSQCIRVPASPHLVRPAYYRGDQLWTQLRVTVEGHQIDLDLRLVTTKQPLGGERRWFACPNCRRRVGCLYAPWITEPFACRWCHNLLYDSQYAPRDAELVAARAFLKLEKALARIRPNRGARGAGSGSTLDLEALRL